MGVEEEEIALGGDIYFLVTPCLGSACEALSGTRIVGLNKSGCPNHRIVPIPEPSILIRVHGTPDSPDIAGVGLTAGTHKAEDHAEVHVPRGGGI